MDAKTLADGFDYQDPRHMFADIKRKKRIRALENDFQKFIAGAWHLVEPNTPYSANWTTKAVGEHLEATLDGTIRNLLINIPPRMMKSLLVNVFFPAWVWTKAPSKQFIFSSYAENLAIRDSIKCRTIVESDWYTSKWPNVTIRKDQNTKKEWVLDQGGHRIITSVGGSAIGKGGDYCGIYYTPVLTEKGYRAINILNVGDKVWSLNHETKELELKPVTHIYRRSVTETVTITTDSRHKSVFTPNHPYYVVGDGYKEAEALLSGDRLIRETIIKGEKIHLLSRVQRMSSYLREKRLGLYDAFTKWKQGILLFSKLCLLCKEEKEKLLQDIRMQQRGGSTFSGIKEVQDLSRDTKNRVIRRGNAQEGTVTRNNKELPFPNSSTYAIADRVIGNGMGYEGNRKKNKTIWFQSKVKRLRQIKKYICFTSLRKLQNSFQEIKSRIFETSEKGCSRFLLFARMYRLTFQNENKKGVCNTELYRTGDEQTKKILRKLQNHKKTKGTISSNILQVFSGSKSVNTLQRQFYMCRLQFKKFFSYASYRFKQGKQQTRKSNNTVQVAPYKISQGKGQGYTEVTGAKVQKNGSKKVTVYDITVEGNHNFFANGILVHNCIADDPNDAKHARSPAKLEDTQFWWDNTMSTRLSNPKTGVKIIIQQRIAEGDLTGHVLKQGGYCHLVIPMRYDPQATKVTDIGWEDPRTEVDELAWPDRFGEAEVKELKLRLGSDGYAGQLQQRPAPKGGKIIKKKWLKTYKELPQMDRTVLSVDCSFKDDETSDYVVMSLWGIRGSYKYLIHLVREKLDIIATIAELRDIHSRFQGINYTLIEDKANGSAIISMIQEKIKGVIPFNPGQDSKPARLNAVAPQIEAGNLWIPDKYYEPNRERFAWCTDILDACIDELILCPKGATDDFVDSMTQVFLKENEGGNWFDEMLKEAENKTQTETLTSNLAEMMGWNIT